uniref:Synapsin pre-ATP-grasp domain-containing protein n=1 Tax=Anopheles farauti TaxID=69004 RepID=A0A182Q7L4_9DIPT
MANSRRHPACADDRYKHPPNPSGPASKANECFITTQKRSGLVSSGFGFEAKLDPNGSGAGDGFIEANGKKQLRAKASCILQSELMVHNIGTGKTSSISARSQDPEHLSESQDPQAGTLSFASFKSSFTSNVNFLKRRFSSGDLSSECEDVDPKDLPPAARPQPPLQQQPMPGGPPNIPPPPAPGTAGSVSPGGPVPPGSAPPTGGPELSLSFGKGPAQRGTSAPSSPAKSRESLLQRVQSLTGAARDQGASIIGAAVSTASRVQPFNRDKCFTLLVVDDQNTDWSKYFRGKRLHSDYDIRVEQAEFREIMLTASADSGPMVGCNRGGSKQAKPFRPDFILVRQPPRDGSKDYRSTLLGLKYGGVPSINSLHSLYQFQDKPWVFAHLLQLQRRLGREAFPLVEQTFFPNPKDMIPASPRFSTIDSSEYGRMKSHSPTWSLLAAIAYSLFGSSVMPHIEPEEAVYSLPLRSSFRASSLICQMERSKAKSRRVRDDGCGEQKGVKKDDKKAKLLRLLRIQPGIKSAATLRSVCSPGSGTLEGGRALTVYGYGSSVVTVDSR